MRQVSKVIPIVVTTTVSTSGDVVEVAQFRAYTIHFQLNGATLGSWYIEINPDANYPGTVWQSATSQVFNTTNVQNFAREIIAGSYYSHNGTYSAVHRHMRISCSATSSGGPPTAFLVGEYY